MWFFVVVVQTLRAVHHSPEVIALLCVSCFCNIPATVTLEAATCTREILSASQRLMQYLTHTYKSGRDAADMQVLIQGIQAGV